MTAAQLRHLGVEVANTTEGSLRPLRWMIRNDYADRMPEVWRAATQLADGDSPS